MSETTTLKVGYGRADITPTVQVGLGGYDNSNKRLFKGVLDPIYATCIAFSDGEETVLLYTVDNCAISGGVAEDLRPPIEAATGIPGTHQFFGATHTHSGPSHGPSVIGGVEAAQVRLDGLIQAAKTALADLSPATTYAGCAHPEKLNFIRHYTLVDGTVTDSVWKYPVEQRAGHPTESNTNMVLIKFVREGKKDILLVNWHAHADHSHSLVPGMTKDESFYLISADYPGALRNKIQAETGMDVAFFTGSSGNQNCNSFIPAEDHGLGMQAIGEKLAEIAIAALPTLKKVEGGGVACSQEVFAVNVNHTLDHMVDKAREVYAYYQETDLAISRPLAHSYGMQSAYEARAIISRSEMEDTIEFDMGAIRVGGIGFACGTYEMFADEGKFIHANAPYAQTMVVSGNNGYIPSSYAYDFGAYEAVTGFFEKGTAEKLAGKFVDMLTELK